MKYVIKSQDFYVIIDEYENVQYTKEKGEASVYENLTDIGNVVDHCQISGAIPEIL
jgi:hypothetical protein